MLSIKSPIVKQSFTPHTNRVSLSKKLILRKPAQSKYLISAEQKKNIVRYESKNKNENMKHLSLVGMLFSKLTVYTIVRDTKDVLLVTSCGAEAIPFMKTWFNFPLSILSILYFTFLVNKGLSSKWIYRYTYLPIAALYSFVGLVLYPNRALIQPTINIVHPYIHPVFAAISNNWVSGLFYSLSSIWGSTVISLLFWMIANEYTDMKKAKEIYPLFGFLANFALIFAGVMITQFGSIYVNDWDMNMRMLMSMTFMFSCISYSCFEYLVGHFEPTNIVSKMKKSKLRLRDGLLNMWKEPFIRDMVLIIACYGSCIALYETCWKQYMKVYFDSPVAYSKFMGMISYTKGLFTMFMMVVSSFTLKRMKFTHSLLITPIALSGIGVLFFMGILFDVDKSIIVYLGAVMGICTKALKYSFFDPNKEIAYMPMSQEIKTKGKATIEVISNPLGKSGSSMILQGMILLCGTLTDALPMIALYFVIVCCVWIYAVDNLGRNHSTF